MREPPVVGPETWPGPYEETAAAAMKGTLTAVLEAVSAWAVDGPAAEAGFEVAQCVE